MPSPIMRFMTMAWWRGEVEHGDTFERYRKHLETIRDRLPTELSDFHSRVTLHDSRLQDFSFDYTQHKVSINLLGEFWEPNKDPHHSCRWRLIYEDVQSIRAIADPDGGLPGPSGFGDLGYDELDVTDAGHVVHRMLFSTSIELEIVFGKLHTSREDLH